MNTPIYDELAAQRGVDVPDNPDPMPTYVSLFSTTAEGEAEQMPPEHQHSHGGEW